MVSVRLSLILLTAAALMASTSQAAVLDNKYASSSLHARSNDITPQLLKRVHASRPYAPDLFLRQALEDADEEESEEATTTDVDDAADEESEEEDADVVAKRAMNLVNSQNTASSSMSWGALFKRAEQSEEELHERGLVDDEEIEKRGRCGSDNDCDSSQYCSSKRNRCYRKLSAWKGCSRDGACSTGYCCESTGRCEPPRTTGRTCHGKDNACNSGYCSVVSDKCRQPAQKGESCRVDSGCYGSLSCVNGQCNKSQPSKPSHPQHPNHPSPSGSPKHPRALTSSS